VDVWSRGRHAYRALCSILAVTVAGCGALSGYPTDYQDMTTLLAVDQPYLAADVRTKGDDPSDAARGGLTQQQYRDTVVYRRLEIIDNYYYDFEAKLIGTYNSLDVSADLAVLALSGLGATTGAAATKAVLAAASAGVIGAKNTVNTDIFYQKTLPALIAEMRAARLKVLLTIESGLTNAVSKYSIDQALNDVNAYYVAGSLPSAIAEITNTAGAAQSKASADIAALRTIKYQAPTTNASKIISWLFPNGDETQKLDGAKLTQLIKWMESYKTDPRLAQIPYIIFLNGTDPLFENDRAQAIKDLNIS
jgi:hypothetical protein